MPLFRQFITTLGLLLVFFASAWLHPAFADDVDWGSLLSEEESSPEPVKSYSFSGKWLFKGSADLSHEQLWEDIADIRSRLFIEGTYRKGETFSARISGYADYTALFGNAGRQRDFQDPALYEAFVTFRKGPVDFRLGRQIITWGKADFLNPTDNINPRDFRNFFADSEIWDLKIPVTVAEIDGYAGPFTFKGYWVPFFEPMRISLLGTDWSFLRLPNNVAVLGPPLSLPDLNGFLWKTNPSLLHRAEDFLSYGGVQKDRLGESEFGFKFEGRHTGWDWSMSYLYTWDDLPVLDAGAGFDAMVQDGLVTPLELFGFIDGLLNAPKMYHRAHVVGGDFSATLGSIGLRGEAAWYSDRTVYSDDFSSVIKPWVSYALGIDHQFPRQVYAIFQVFGSHYLDVPFPDESLSLFKKNTYMAMLLLNARLLRDKLMPELRALVNLTQNDFFLTPRIAYKITDTFELAVGAHIFEGEQDLLFGFFDKNDEGFVMATWSF